MKVLCEYNHIHDISPNQDYWKPSKTMEGRIECRKELEQK